MNIGRFIWGIILILIGAIFLLVNYNFLDPSIWTQIWKLWPIFIILLGLSILSKGASTIVTVLLSLFALVVIVIGLIGVIKPTILCNGERCDQRTAVQEQVAEPVQDQSDSAEIIIETGAANLSLEGGSNLLVEGSIKSTVSGFNISRRMTNGTDKITLSMEHGRGFFWMGSFRNDWDLQLNRSLPLDLILKTGAVDAKIDLTNTNLNNLNIQTGASSYNISYPEKEGLISSEISAGASSFTIGIPEKAKVKVSSETGLSSTNFEKFGLVRNGNNFQSVNYEDSPSQIEITLKAGVSSVELISL